MRLEKIILKTIILVFFISCISCEKDKNHELSEAVNYDTLNLLKINSFLYNIPINQDTIFLDTEHNIDFRVEIEGYQIDSVFFNFIGGSTVKFDTSIISTDPLFFTSEGIFQIDFRIWAINEIDGAIVNFKSEQAYLQVLDNLGEKFIKHSIVNGRLRVEWPELDKLNTQKYLIERLMGENMEYSEEFEVRDSIYDDIYYVGEEAHLKISVINNDGNKQRIWYYKKMSEQPTFSVSQNPLGGYTVNFSKSKYYNSFGEYYLTTGLNTNPEYLFSSSDINDTIYSISDAKFADEARFWLRYLPSEYPQGVTEQDWMLYGTFLYTRYGMESFKYDRIAILNNNNIVYTLNGDIFKSNLITNQKSDSIINNNADYGFLRATPGGEYLYAFDDKDDGPIVYFWNSTSLSTNPDYNIQVDYIIPPVSDNLIAIMSVPSNISPSKLALYNITNGNRIYTTEYNATSSRPSISSNGQYFFIDDSDLKLCSYINNSFNLIWEEGDWSKYYRFYDFNPSDNAICYVWDDNKLFSTRNTSDFSEINSFPLDLEEIINIDYTSNKIMGYVTDLVKIYNLENGVLEKEIPANLSDLFFYSNNAILIGDAIYSNYGIKYNIQ